MPPPEPRTFSAKVRDILRGLGELGEVLKEGTVALIEVAIGRWPKPFAAPSEEPKAPNEGMGPIKKLAAFPAED
jgi:hypothetical protein